MHEDGNVLIATTMTKSGHNKADDSGFQHYGQPDGG